MSLLQFDETGDLVDVAALPALGGFICIFISETPTHRQRLVFAPQYLRGALYATRVTIRLEKRPLRDIADFTAIDVVPLLFGSEGLTHPHAPSAICGDV